MIPQFHIRVALTAVVMIAWCGRVGAEPAPATADAAFFESQVKPLLQSNCLKCHGGEEQAKDNFRLTTQASLLKGGDDGPPINLEHPDQSLLLKAINYDGDLKMPPRAKLPPEKIEILARWVRGGAAWPAGVDLTPPSVAQNATPQRPDPPTPLAARKSFWSFQPVKRPAVPEVKDAAWVRNPIDAFILAKLEAKGLTPAPPAGKISLLRRATYDLTGLPPTPAEVDAFVADNSPDAYERVIDRLLASPHYGEQWGRHWLDVVRYGETNSYERDNPKPNVWRYRDYVIRSFNNDKPYDRFVKEQLAGDEMPQIDGEPDPIIATAYYRLGIWDDEPGDRLQARYDNLDDLVTTTGQVFMGLTVDCARCHNHKLDPILQTDYYRLLAFFQNINGFNNGGKGDESEIFEHPGDREAYEKLVADRHQQADKVQGRITEIEDRFRELSMGAGKDALGKSDIHDLHYRYYRDTWQKLPDFDNLKFESEGDLKGGLLDLSPRTRDVAFGFVFTGTLEVPADGNYLFHLDSDDGSRLILNGKVALDYDGIHGTGAARDAKVELHKGRVPLRFEYFQNEHGFGLDLSWEGPGVEKRPLSAPIAAKPRGKMPEGDLTRIIKEQGKAVLGEAMTADYLKLRKKLTELTQPVPADRALRVSENGVHAPDTFVCLRGSASNPGPIVQPGFPSVLADGDAVIPPPARNAASTGRRTVLANWITSDANPLFARVMANRIFQYHFGRGIVRSPNNFGIQGDKPTHPELLEWLSSEFRLKGYTFKQMHRLIMTSSAYRMSTAFNPSAMAVDPQNDLLWRFDLRRLSAEEVRDSILVANGALNDKMFGPSVFPLIPAEVLAGQSRPGTGWSVSPPRDAARRSIYVHVKRSLPLPILQAFDAAESDHSCPVRFVTVQPTQALGMLNGQFLNEQSATFAAHLKEQAGDDVEKQIALAFRLTTCRQPTDGEVARARELIESLKTKDGASSEQAMKYFCLMMLNLNEFVFLD